MLPRRLREDCVVEALVEWRFETDEVPELVFSRLVEAERWRKFAAARLPASDMPAQMRAIDANLRYQATLQRASPDGTEIVRIGPNTLSFHQMAPYGGWETFRPKIHDALSSLKAAAHDARIQRIGFRYLNVLEKNRHGIANVSGLNVNISIGKGVINNHFVLNYTRDHDPRLVCTVRIASKEFVQTSDPHFDRSKDFVYVDIDVFTTPNVAFSGPDEVMAWIEDAHTVEKRAFFELIPKNSLKDMVAEWK